MSDEILKKIEALEKEIKELKLLVEKDRKRKGGEKTTIPAELKVGDRVRITNLPNTVGTVVKINRVFVSVQTQDTTLRRTPKNLQKLEE